MDEYEKQASEFLTKTNTTFKAEFVKYAKHFNCDTSKRDIYKCTFERGNRSFFVMFGQSIVKSLRPDYLKQLPKSMTKKERTKVTPTAYDVLSCLQKYDVGDFSEFCDEFGYNNNSVNAHNTYKLICEEFANVQRLWTDAEIEKLQEV